jgi:hypothetical protein
MNQNEYVSKLCEQAQEDGFPILSKFLGRMAKGEPLFQIVVEGGVVSDVIGIPEGCTYSLVDFDVLEAGGSDVVELLRNLNPEDTQGLDDEEVLDKARDIMEGVIWNEEGE